MIQIQWWWSRSSDDLDPVMMIQIKWWSRSNDEYDLNMKMNWIWQGLDDDLDDKYKKNCADKLCWENTFLVKRECWCICNFKMYSSVYIMYCTTMFFLICVYNVIESCHTLMFIPRSFYNVNKSCQVIVGNPPNGQGLKSPQLWGPRVIRLS